ncbi:protein serine/threonine phosphatase 2C [Obba rivulosa]|uniref:Protein phosphatase n=1 Tax=Obba rivulosa TaxID=1052685 RepID=A0A8E2DTS8_9APHY|nr:protein serine/threonine phosphatase 2C [Obba rivulosa]
MVLAPALRVPKPSIARRSAVTRAYSSLPRPYRFHVGTSWEGKLQEPRLRFKGKPFAPETEIGQWRDASLARHKVPAGSHIGEDFFFVQDMRNQSGLSFGVADGVGGWVDSGVDPSLFSQALMFHSQRYFKMAWAGEPEIDPTQEYEEREQVEGWELPPSECMKLAYDGVLRERLVTAGSSTACLLTLNASSGLLRAANLGDSGFSIIRSSKVLHHQSPQTHYFNCPKQLSKAPKSLFRGTIADSPQTADLFETQLRDGDLVIAYTDGLTDNVFPEEIAWICAAVARQFATLPSQSQNHSSDSPSNERLVQSTEDRMVQTMANHLVDYAQKAMAMKNRVSPFERTAALEGLYWRGGKIDDVTVIVALVRETL